MAYQDYNPGWKRELAWERTPQGQEQKHADRINRPVAFLNRVDVFLCVFLPDGWEAARRDILARLA